MSVSIYGKRERGVIRRRRIIGVSTMVLAVLLLALPLYTRATVPTSMEVLVDATTGEVRGNCGTQGTIDPSTGFGDSVTWVLAHPVGADPADDTTEYTLYIEYNDTAVISGGNKGKMVDFTVPFYNDPSATVTDTRPWKDHLDKIKNIEIQTGVTTIGNYAFADYSWDASPTAIATSNTAPREIKSVTLPDTLTEIGTSAFDLSGITAVTLPDSLTKIGDYAFRRTNLQSVTIPDKVQSIGSHAFYNVDTLKSLALYKDATASELSTIGESAFAECNTLEGGVSFPTNRLREIGVAAFQNDTKLGGVIKIPDTVETIGATAFKGCEGFNGALTISEKMTEIPASAFEGCKNVTSLVIPDTTQLATIGEKAFYNCEKLSTPITLPATMKDGTIGNNAFVGTTAADTIRFLGGAPKTVTPSSDNNRSFDAEDVVQYPNAEDSFTITTDDAGTNRWNGYRVTALDGAGKPIVHPAFSVSDQRTAPTGVGTLSATVTGGSSLPDEGKGFRLVVRDLLVNETDNLKAALDRENKIGADDLYHVYDIQLWDYRNSANPKQVTGDVKGTVTLTIPLPAPVVDAIKKNIADGLTQDEWAKRLTAYAGIAAASGNTMSFQEKDFTIVSPAPNADGNILVEIRLSHFSPYAFLYDPYVPPTLESWHVADGRTADGSDLYKGVEGGGTPTRSKFTITNGINEATGEFDTSDPKSPTSTDGWYLSVTPDEGDDILGLKDGQGNNLRIDQYRLFAPCNIKLFYDDGKNGAVEHTEGFGKVNIWLPIPEEMDPEKGTIEVIGYNKNANGQGTPGLDHWTRTQGGGLTVGIRPGRNVYYASFTVDHFSEFALYYVMDSSASNTSTTSSTASTASSTGSSSANAATTGNSGGTGNSGASNTGATNSGATNSGTNTGTTGASSATGASGSSGGSGSTNSGTGSSGSSGTDMPRTGDADFYRMTISVALLLFGAYELISTIRIRKRRG